MITSRMIPQGALSTRLLLRYKAMRMTSVSLTGIQRQSDAEYRSAIEAFRVSPDQGFAKLQDLGAIREIPYLKCGRPVAETYREMSADPGKSVLVNAATHEEIGRATHSIREELKQSGLLGRSEVLQQHIPLQWTEAQKKDTSNYQPGQVLVSHRSSHGVEKHEALAVMDAVGDTVRTCNDRGEDVSVNLTQARSYSVPKANSQVVGLVFGEPLMLERGTQKHERPSRVKVFWEPFPIGG